MAKNKAIKIYKACSIFSTTVLVKSERKHISFLAYANGGSFYQTEDPEIQAALESSKFFNDLFYLASTETLEEKPAKAKKAKAADIFDTPEQEPEAEEAPAEIREIAVAGLAEAKEYLAYTYEINRTSLRTKADILKAAEEHNIKFIGI